MHKSQWIRRRENWLLILPLASVVLFMSLLRHKKIDIHLHDTYFIIEYSVWFIVELIFLLPVFVLHLLLKMKERLRAIRNTHFWTTVLLLAWIPIECVRFSGTFVEPSFSFCQTFFLFLIVLLLAVQLLFIIAALANILLTYRK